MFKGRLHLTILFLLIGLAACSPQKAASPTAVPFDLSRLFPAANAIPGWGIVQEMKSYDKTNLFDLVDGQAESFFAYGFERVTVQRYQNADGTLLNMEIWQLATEADAYGLFSAGRAGKSVAVGNEGDSDPGRRLAFWQNRFFASLNASQSVPDETLQAFAGTILEALPAGGTRPALLDSLPQEGLVPLSPIFFHEEMSIQMEIWLGGENILGLSQQTDGVVARYQIDSQTVRLLLVDYPDEGGVAKGLNALRTGSLTDLLASNAKDRRLGAVFGKIAPQLADELLTEALK